MSRGWPRRRAAPWFARCAAGLVASAALGASTAACTSAGTAVSTPFGTTPPTLEHGPFDEVKLMQISGLGRVLVDGKGIALYMFTSDRRGAPSRCYDICAVQWPPLFLTGGASAPTAGPGVDASLLGTVPRTDGTTQVTYHGWPLYLWPPDHVPGTATGQALTNAGGRWFVLDAAGNPVKTP